MTHILYLDRSQITRAKSLSFVLLPTSNSNDGGQTQRLYWYFWATCWYLHDLPHAIALLFYNSQNMPTKLFACTHAFVVFFFDVLLASQTKELIAKNFTLAMVDLSSHQPQSLVTKIQILLWNY